MKRREVSWLIAVMVESVAVSERVKQTRVKEWNKHVWRFPRVIYAQVWWDQTTVFSLSLWWMRWTHNLKIFSNWSVLLFVLKCIKAAELSISSCCHPVVRVQHTELMLTSSSVLLSLLKCIKAPELSTSSCRYPVVWVQHTELMLTHFSTDRRTDKDVNIISVCYTHKTG